MTYQRQILFPRLGAWIEIKDGDPCAKEIFERHYSARKYRDGRITQLFAGPGKKMILITIDRKALFVWRKFRDHCIPEQTGINCAIFRNEDRGKYRSSELILEAEAKARERWPNETRFYTYIDENKIRRKRDPGRCFRLAGWLPAGYTKVHKLLILEKIIDLEGK